MDFKLFSRCQAEANGELPDVYEYDCIPETFRNQLAHVILTTISYKNNNFDLFEVIDKTLSEHLGKLSLGYSYDSDKNVIDFISNSSTSDFLDLLDFVLYLFSLLHKEQNLPFYKDANERIEHWMKYNSLGYEFLNDNLVRIDNKIIHHQAVQPAFLLLTDQKFSGANEEMRQAYEARRTGNNADAIVNANKAFESVMKVICKEKHYVFDPVKDTASRLIAILKDNGYFPPYLDSHITGIRTTLESGLPTVRNKTAVTDKVGNLFQFQTLLLIML